MVRCLTSLTLTREYRTNRAGPGLSPVEFTARNWDMPTATLITDHQVYCSCHPNSMDSDYESMVSCNYISKTRV